MFLPFPFTDLTAAKKRPVLIVCDADGGGDFVAVPITSQSGHLNTVSIAQKDLSNCTLPKASWVKADKPFTLNKSLVVKQFGQASASLMQQVQAHLCKSLGC